MKSSQRCTSEGSPVVAARCGASFSATRSASKKSLRAAEQERGDVARARRRWMREQGMFDSSRLVFLDETATSTNMVRLRSHTRGKSISGDRTGWLGWEDSKSQMSPPKL